MSNEDFESSESPPPQPSPGVPGEGAGGNPARLPSSAAPEQIEVSETANASVTVDDLPRMFEPPPVKLVTVQDAALLAPAGMETELDAFYVGMLQFDRDTELPLAYRAANFALVFQVVELVGQQNMRVMGIDVQSLSVARQKLIDREIEHVLQRGVLPGHVSILLQDPAGNWIELFETSMMR